MVSKFKNMMDTKDQEEEKKVETQEVPLTNGIPTKEGLLIIVRSMAEQARVKILENSIKFMHKR